MNGNCGECDRRWYCNIDPAVCEKMTNPVPTNGDRIRALTDEELAEILTIDGCKIPDPWQCSAKDCIECALKWLQQPAEVDHAAEE